ncbi:MAG TPA: formyltransferase family protein, partial [Pirellulales bacterium]
MRVAVLISGGGTTLKNLLAKNAAGELTLDVAVVISSTKHAKGLAIAAAAGIPTLIVSGATHPGLEAASEAIFA